MLATTILIKSSVLVAVGSITFGLMLGFGIALLLTLRPLGAADTRGIFHSGDRSIPPCDRFPGSSDSITNIFGLHDGVNWGS